MLPPIDPATLSANPKFDALYRDLCANKLNEDGTSKLDAKTRKEQQAFAETLRKARVETAKQHLLQDGLQSLVNGRSELPDELLELVAITAVYIGGEIAQEDKELVEYELEKFQDNSKPITTALSKQLHADATTLSQILDPDNPPPTNELKNAVESLQTSIATSRAQLAQKRLALAHDISTLHSLYRQIIASSIRTLEQTLHGSIARGTKAKAEYLAVVAEGMSKKLELQYSQLLQQVYSVEMLEVLKAKAGVVEEEMMVVRRKVRVVEEELEGYRRVRGMRGMVRELAEIEGECERVQEELGRLGGGRG